MSDERRKAQKWDNLVDGLMAVGFLAALFFGVAALMQLLFWLWPSHLLLAGVLAVAALLLYLRYGSSL